MLSSLRPKTKTNSHFTAVVRRSEESISDAVLRDMVRSWHPDSSRTPGGYYKNVSLSARIDPFTGMVTGAGAPAALSATRPGEDAIADGGIADSGGAGGALQA